ncbi:hypothetical protein K431DRAFT_340310 [Polychaeton citri CBS 116435]|uniref:Mmc1 C-terminal domain-containing protein n=1 Tax=Polychaeton citri CBS 116435 TaxID=1314669 RepID=A0A9P4UNG0_9PEZI|nr:hypothetical protein K431DRAFT_340310 [Polychaeton citri CBS 116435]
MPLRHPVTSLRNGLVNRIAADYLSIASSAKTVSRHTRALHHIAPRYGGKGRDESFARQYTNGSLASSTAINAPSVVPSEFRELHQQIHALREQAGSYVDLSRLQLALRSLESEQPTLRIAFLGLGTVGGKAARKLARALFSDALGDEGYWERELLSHENDGRAILLRYGEDDGYTPQQQNALVKEIAVPSAFLEKNKLEILITPYNSNGDASNGGSASEDALLVPPLATPTSAGGRVGFVRYPVHKALLVTEGIAGALDYGRIRYNVQNSDLVGGALSLPLRQAVDTSETTENTVSGETIDIDLANHGLDLFRASNANGAVFSENWQTSRMQAVLDWLAAARGTTEQNTRPNLNPTVASNISSMLQATSMSIASAERTLPAAATTSIAIPDSKREDLQSAIGAWSASAHRDLQFNLTTAFSSPTWKRTAWWRLIWRIDDITLSASSILQNSYLLEAETSLANLCGRIEESGLATPAELKEASPSLLSERLKLQLDKWESQRENNANTAAELLQLPTMLSREQLESGLNAFIDPPWPQTITLSRQQALHALVPTFHRKAQGYLVQMLTTTGGSTALGAWLWVATGGVAVYEAGAIVSLGLVWALRRLQKKWGRDREDFKNTVEEDGRRVLAEVEGLLRRVVGEGGRVAVVESEDAGEWRNARVAVERCQEALARLQAIN